MSNIGTKTYKAKIGLSDTERQKFNDDAVNEANRVANEYIAENTERTETALGGIENFGGRLATAEEKVDKKLDKDGYSGLAHVGLADNIASPDGVIDTEPYTFRPTAGETSVSDGYAEIKEIKGNTVILNQLVKNGNFANGTTDWFMQNGTFNVADNVATFTQSDLSIGYSRLTQTLQNTVPVGHKTLVHFEIKHDYSSNIDITYCFQKDASFVSIEPNKWTTINVIQEPSGESPYLSISTHNVSLASPCNVSVKNVVFIDLTKMFGAGKEPATVADFYNLTRNMDTDTYNEGQFINSLPINLISTGFNAFDGELESGYYNSLGAKAASSNWCRSVNLIQVVGGKKYTLTHNGLTGTTQTTISEFDKYKKIITTNYVYSGTSLTATLNERTVYVALSFNKSGIGSELPANAQICFHLTHSGYRNGQYEPFEQFVRPLPVFKYFPEGMKSAGTAYDSLTPTKAIKRIGSVDLGTLNYFVSNSSLGIVGTETIANLIKKHANNETIANIICDKYTSAKATALYSDATEIIAVENNGTVDIKSSAFIGKTALEVKALLSGQILYYELAEPVETELEQTRANDWFYRISDFGTEEQLVVDGFAPAVIETFYMNNLRDKLRNLPDIPKCEDTTGTSVLKCINGTLTWVKETATTEE